jgi:hypothetical protein
VATEATFFLELSTPHQNVKVKRAIATLYGKTRSVLNAARITIPYRERLWENRQIYQYVIGNEDHVLLLQPKFYNYAFYLDVISDSESAGVPYM